MRCTKYRVAKMLHVAPRTVDRMVERGDLPEPERDDDGTLLFDVEAVEAAAAAAAEASAAAPAGVVREATELQRAAAESLQWLVKQQQSMITDLSRQMREGMVAWAEAVRGEAEMKLEAEVAMSQERRRDEALRAVSELVPDVMSKAMAARAGSKVIERLSALDDEQWATLSGMAVELLGLSEQDVAMIAAMRKERKEQEDGKDND